MTYVWGGGNFQRENSASVNFTNCNSPDVHFDNFDSLVILETNIRKKNPKSQTTVEKLTN